jgi:DNA cross-link repair 1A protein
MEEEETTFGRLRRLFGLQKSASAPSASDAMEREAKRAKQEEEEPQPEEEDEEDEEEDQEEEVEPEQGEQGEEEQENGGREEGRQVVAKGQEFKQIPDTRFIVDGFKLRDLPDDCTFFLSHFHSDHYGGITRNWKRAIYCSAITGKLLVQSIGVPAQLIRVLTIGEPVEIRGVRVSVFDANHCPGALLLLFETPTSKTLHVGDFRWSRRILAESPRLAALKPREITHLFLDTTFNDPRFDFPEQSRVIASAIELVRGVLKTYRNPLVIFGSYSIGKEKLFVAVAQALGEKLYASEEKQRLLRPCCADMSIFVSDRDKARLHVTGLGKSGFNGLKALEAKLGNRHDVYVGIAPTGWTWCKFDSWTVNLFLLMDVLSAARIPKKTAESKPYSVRAHGSVIAYGVPYSEHSSYSELINCVAHFRPVSITPTVHNGGRTREAIAKQLVPFHPYIDLSRDKSTIVGLFSAPSPAPLKRSVSEPLPKIKPPPRQEPPSLQKSLLSFFGRK